MAMHDATPPSNGTAAPDDKAKEAKAKKKVKKGEEDKDADLSEEDLELKKNLELMVERIREGDSALQAAALKIIAQEIRSATTSMTSVPKPLKFLRSHYGTPNKNQCVLSCTCTTRPISAALGTSCIRCMDHLNRASCERSGSLKEAYERTPTGDNKRGLADVLSVLAITTGKEGERESLRFRLEGSKVRAESTCQGSNHCLYGCTPPQRQSLQSRAHFRADPVLVWFTCKMHELIPVSTACQQVWWVTRLCDTAQATGVDSQAVCRRRRGCGDRQGLRVWVLVSWLPACLLG